MLLYSKGGEKMEKWIEECKDELEGRTVIHHKRECDFLDYIEMKKFVFVEKYFQLLKGCHVSDFVFCSDWYSASNVFITDRFNDYGVTLNGMKYLEMCLKYFHTVILKLTEKETIDVFYQMIAIMQSNDVKFVGSLYVKSNTIVIIGDIDYYKGESEMKTEYFGDVLIVYCK